MYIFYGKTFEYKIIHFIRKKNETKLKLFLMIDSLLLFFRSYFLLLDIFVVSGIVICVFINIINLFHLNYFSVIRRVNLKKSNMKYYKYYILNTYYKQIINILGCYSIVFFQHHCFWERCASYKSNFSLVLE